jgi:membrane protein DedA with SNARE-associated domain
VTTYLDGLLVMLKSLPDFFLYIALGLSAFAENIFPPIPGDTIIVFGAFLVGTERLDFFGVYIVTTLGSVSGFMSLFWVGSLLGRRFFIERNYRFFKAQKIIRAEGWYRRHGYLLMLLNRFIPGGRSVISIVGGISRLSVFKVALFALLSSCTWNLIWIRLGYELGSKWETVRDNMANIMVRYNFAVLALLCPVVVIFLVRNVSRREK